MWARRCGAPKRWPSRVKVTIFSFFYGTIGLSIYQYMAGSNVSYLDLSQPASGNVVCLTEWPSNNAVTWSRPREWLAWLEDRGDLEEMLTKHRCTVPGIPHTSCSKILAPISDMTRPLALPMTGDDIERYDILNLWARIFLMMTFFIWLGMITHDLALIGNFQKDFILDVTGVNSHCPVIRRLWRCLAGYRPLFRILEIRKPWQRVLAMSVAASIAPALLIWNVLVFNLVIVPMILLAFVRYPIRMCRAWVFIVCIATFLYGLALACQQLAYGVLASARPRYAVTWELSPAVYNLTATTPDSACICGCDYPISVGVCVNLGIIGAATAIKSLFMALRCLKGLRRSQWANLLSVDFPVPITVYSVQWRQRNGQPIKFRDDKMAVQEEVAFDPFAMMDEQLDSAFTTVNLAPAPVHTYKLVEDGRLSLVAPGRDMQMPAMPPLVLDSVQLLESEYIGCCGFPWPTGGRKGVYVPEFMKLLENESKPFEVFETLGHGLPAVRLVLMGPVPQPQDHLEPRWDFEDEAGEVCVELTGSV